MQSRWGRGGERGWGETKKDSIERRLKAKKNHLAVRDAFGGIFTEWSAAVNWSFFAINQRHAFISNNLGCKLHWVPSIKISPHISTRYDLNALYSHAAHCCGLICCCFKGLFSRKTIVHNFVICVCSQHLALTFRFGCNKFTSSISI